MWKTRVGVRHLKLGFNLGTLKRTLDKIENMTKFKVIV